MALKYLDGPFWRMMQEQMLLCVSRGYTLPMFCVKYVLSGAESQCIVSEKAVGGPRASRKKKNRAWLLDLEHCSCIQ